MAKKATVKKSATAVVDPAVKTINEHLLAAVLNIKTAEETAKKMKKMPEAIQKRISSLHGTLLRSGLTIKKRLEGLDAKEAKKAAARVRKEEQLQKLQAKIDKLQADLK